LDRGELSSKKKENNSNALDRYKLSKLEALRFKMDLQTKNLNLLTGYDQVDLDGNPRQRTSAYIKN
jgi:hypothetical protein